MWHILYMRMYTSFYINKYIYIYTNTCTSWMLPPVCAAIWTFLITLSTLESGLTEVGSQHIQNSKICKGDVHVGYPGRVVLEDDYQHVTHHLAPTRGWQWHVTHLGGPWRDAGVLVIECSLISHRARGQAWNKPEIGAWYMVNWAGGGQRLGEGVGVGQGWRVSDPMGDNWSVRVVYIEPWSRLLWSDR